MEFGLPESKERFIALVEEKTKNGQSLDEELMAEIIFVNIEMFSDALMQSSSVRGKIPITENNRKQAIQMTGFLLLVTLLFAQRDYFASLRKKHTKLSIPKVRQHLMQRCSSLLC